MLMLAAQLAVLLKSQKRSLQHVVLVISQLLVVQPVEQERSDSSFPALRGRKTMKEGF